MTPEQWDRMSWHARRRYLHALSEREKKVAEELKRLYRLRSKLKENRAPKPRFDPKANLRIARQMASKLPTDPPEVIAQRQQALIHTFIHNEI